MFSTLFVIIRVFNYLLHLLPYRVLAKALLGVGHVLHGVHSTVRLVGGAVALNIEEGNRLWTMLAMVLIFVALVEVMHLTKKLMRAASHDSASIWRHVKRLWSRTKR